MPNFSIENGYVFYHRMAFERQRSWKGQRQKGVDPGAVETEGARMFKDAKESLAQYQTELLDASQYGQDFKTIAGRLEKIAAIEFEKESRFLSDVFGLTSVNYNSIQKDMGNYSTFIEQLNSVIGLREKYKDLIQFFKRHKLKKPVGTREMGNFAIAPSFSLSYLQKAMNEVIREKVIKALNTEDFSELEDPNAVDQIMEEVTHRFVTNMGKVESQVFDNPFGQSKPVELFSLLSEIDIDSQHLKPLKGVLSEPRWGAKKMVKKMLEELKELPSHNKWHGKTADQVAEELLSDFKMDPARRTGHLTGELNEHLGVMIHDIRDIIVNSLGEDRYTRTAQVLTSNMAKIDMVVEYSMKGNTSQIDDLQAVMQGNNNLREAAEAISKNTLNMPEGDYRVYESSKMYNLGKVELDAFQGGALQLNQLGAFFAQVAPDSARFGHLLQGVYPQFIPGAIADGNSQLQEAINRSVSNYLSQFMAELLFDDYQTIGSESQGRNVLHVFRLSHIVVPLSFLTYAFANALRSIADDDEAMNAARKYFKFHFTIPSSIRYPDPPPRAYDGRYPKREPGFWDHPKVLDRWNDQREAAQNGITFAYKFLANMRSLIEHFL